MDGSIRLSDAERKMAFSIYRSVSSAQVARRAHVLLLLDAGRSYRPIMDCLFSSRDLVTSVKKRYLEGGFDEALAEEPDVETGYHRVPVINRLVDDGASERSNRDSILVVERI